MIVVQTCPARGVNYLESTLELIQRQTDAQVLIFPDVNGVGARYAFWSILENAAPLQEDLIVLQDDVVPCVGAMEAALGLRVPYELPFVTMFDNDNRLEGVGLRRIRLDGPFRHAQALKLPYTTVGALVKVGIPPTPFEHGHGSDWALGVALHRLGWREYGVTAPSWFQHAGKVSAVNPTRRGFPYAKNWAAWYDARTWKP